MIQNLLVDVGEAAVIARAKVGATLLGEAVEHHAFDFPGASVPSRVPV